MPHRVWLLRGPLKHTRLSGLLGLYGNIILLRVYRVFTRKRAYSPGGDSLNIDDYDVESFGIITLDGFMKLGEEKRLFFHGVVVSDLSTGPARIELKFGCYCHVLLKFFSSSPTTRPATNTYHPVASRFLFYLQGIFCPINE